MIEKLRIPDEDVPGWMQTLREGGFTDNEIDSILGNLNQTYLNETRKVYVRSELSRMTKEIEDRKGSTVPDDVREALKQGIESRFK